jgi:hypothetical protein
MHTRKHFLSVPILQNTTILVPKVPEKNYTCENCNKTYKHHSSLWTHKKKCIDSTNQIQHQNQNIITNTEFCLTKEMFLELMKSNNELQKQIVELSKYNNITNSNNIINNNNSHNKTFNLQVFLNENCKNAMNIMDFVDSLQLQLSDLENVGRLGFVDGLSNIIIKNLKALDVTMRPVHCSDSKRETMYVKDNDKWEKDDETNTKLRKAIKYIAHKNTKLIPQWKAKHPDYLDSFSNHSDQYNDLMLEALGGDPDLHSSVNENKIIKKIAKEVTIDKKNIDY